MSSYQKLTKHPKTGKWQRAWWLDDALGRHHYGVRFDGDDEYYDPEKLSLETKDE